MVNKQKNPVILTTFQSFHSRDTIKIKQCLRIRCEQMDYICSRTRVFEVQSDIKSRPSGMEILSALSLAHKLIHQLDRFDILERGRELFKQQPVSPLLLRYFDSVDELNDSFQLNYKQYTALYACVMKLKIKEYHVNKNALFCNIYIPEQHKQTIRIYQYQNLFYPVIKHEKMVALQICDSLITEVLGSSSKPNYEFDVYPEEVVIEKPVFQRRHKKSFSDHQVIDNARFSAQFKDLLEQETVYHTAQKKEQYEFPPPLMNNQSFQKRQESILDNLQITDLDEPKLKYAGRLKFFDDQKNYGFIVMDGDKSDIFVHLDDLLKAGVTKEQLKGSKQGHMIRFQFNCMVYVGKYKKSRKAVDLRIVNYR